MPPSTRNSRGFTLVEIMIVVVIIGLLAAMAIPAFQKVRQNAMASKMDNDARQIASAAQQYYLETNSTFVNFTCTAAGVVGNPLSSWVKQVGSGYTTFPTALNVTAPFSVLHPLASTARTYNSEGQKQ